MMKVLVTGAKGFIGKNLVLALKSEGFEVHTFDIDSPDEELITYTRDCEFVFHLAGTNRPRESSEFMRTNYGFTEHLLSLLEQHKNKSPVLFASSIQAELDNPYGRSKRAAEDLLFSYAERLGAKVLIYRLPNVFGKWARPDYNSVLATFCRNIAEDREIVIDDPQKRLTLAYIDDVVAEFINAARGRECREGKFCKIPAVYSASLGEIADLLYSFKKSRNDLSIPDMGDEFTKKLYATYLSFLPEDGFSYPLKMNRDSRGSFAEFIKTDDRGQVSVNIIAPHAVKGNHWHNTKTEKFLVVSGKGVVRFYTPEGERTVEYFVGGDSLRVVDIPPGYVHSIENLGDEDMVVIMWASEIFNPESADTYRHFE